MLSTIAVTNLSTAVMEDYAKRRKSEPGRARPAGPATILKEIKLIRQAVRWGFDMDMCGPVTFKIPPLSVEEKEARSLIPSELDKLFEACGDDDTYISFTQ